MGDPVIYAPCEHGWLGGFRTHPLVAGSMPMRAYAPVCQGRRRLGTLSEIERALRIVARMDIGGVGITEIERALQIAHAHDSGREAPTE